VRDRPGHDRRYAIDFSKATRDLGYFPRQSLPTGIEATLDGYLSNRVWWQALLDRTYADWLTRNYKH
jgi:dTDP-glucose 4,6-dehydratase